MGMQPDSKNGLRRQIKQLEKEHSDLKSKLTYERSAGDKWMVENIGLLKDLEFAKNKYEDLIEIINKLARMLLEK